MAAQQSEDIPDPLKNRDPWATIRPFIENRTPEGQKPPSGMTVEQGRMHKAYMAQQGLAFRQQQHANAQAGAQANQAGIAQRHANAQANQQFARAGIQQRVQFRAAQKYQQQQQQQLADRQKREAARQQAIGRFTSLAAIRSARGAGTRVAALPQPGGILLMLVILLFFVFAIIPVNGGHTRLSLLWLALIGNASVPIPPPKQSETVFQKAYETAVGDLTKGAIDVGQALGGLGSDLGRGIGVVLHNQFQG